MRIAIDFDGTIVKQDHAYDDLTTPLEFMPGAHEALLSLKRAGHQLLLWSGRCSRVLLVDPGLDPFAYMRALSSTEINAWAVRWHMHVLRRDQMLHFVAEHLHGVFDAVDDGTGGKPIVDVFIDDKALRPAALGGMMGGLSWKEIAAVLGKVDDQRSSE